MRVSGHQSTEAFRGRVEGVAEMIELVDTRRTRANREVTGAQPFSRSHQCVDGSSESPREKQCKECCDAQGRGPDDRHDEPCAMRAINQVTCGLVRSKHTGDAFVVVDGHRDDDGAFQASVPHITEERASGRDHPRPLVRSQRSGGRKRRRPRN